MYVLGQLADVFPDGFWGWLLLAGMCGPLLGLAIAAIRYGIGKIRERGRFIFVFYLVTAPLCLHVLAGGGNAIFILLFMGLMLGGFGLGLWTALAPFTQDPKTRGSGFPVIMPENYNATAVRNDPNDSE